MSVKGNSSWDRPTARVPWTGDRCPTNQWRLGSTPWTKTQNPKTPCLSQCPDQTDTVTVAFLRVRRRGSGDCGGPEGRRTSTYKSRGNLQYSTEVKEVKPTYPISPKTPKVVLGDNLGTHLSPCSSQWFLRVRVPDPDGSSVETGVTSMSTVCHTKTF